MSIQPTDFIQTSFSNHIQNMTNIKRQKSCDQFLHIYLQNEGSLESELLEEPFVLARLVPVKREDKPLENILYNIITANTDRFIGNTLTEYKINLLIKLKAFFNLLIKIYESSSRGPPNVNKPSCFLDLNAISRP